MAKKTGISLGGTDEMMARIRLKMERAQQRLENSSLRQGGEMFAEAQRERVISSDINHLHIKDNIKVSGVRRADGLKYVVIGQGKETSWRVHFVEFGTKKTPARPFIYPSFHENKARVAQFMAAEMRRGLSEG